VDSRSYFATELEAMRQLRDQGLVTMDDSGVQLTPVGWFFVRAVAMVFDRYLQTDRTRARFSKII
jgi:oxygen-independent coproporphyrinogen-3 oxidase